MLVIPAINCKNLKCVKERLETAAEFLPKNKNKRWVQIDISDGKFTKAKSWNNAVQLSNLKLKTYNLRLEAHLMVKDVTKEMGRWCDVADRLIIHVESLENLFLTSSDLRLIKDNIGIAINPGTSIKSLVPYLDKIKFVQLLAVNPGYSGQKFDKKTLQKIKFIKKNYPKVIIEIDGGIDEKTAKLVKNAGANIIVSGSYLFDSKNPKEAYKKLAGV